MNLILLYILSFLAVGQNTDHPFYLSKCQVQYAEEEQSLQISLHLFIDDLELCLEEAGAEPTFLCTEKEHEKAEVWLMAYLENKFQFLVNGQAVQYEWIGKEISEDLMGVWCYLEITGVEELNRLEIKNQLLLERFDEQQHIVHIKGPNAQHGYFLLHKGQIQDHIDF